MSSPQAAALSVEAVGETHIGGRAHNEDTILVRPDLSLYLVADGAGGHNAGNIASALAASSAAHWFEQTKASIAMQSSFDELGLPRAARRLTRAIQHANHEILCLARGSERHRGMGTTIVALHPIPESRLVHIAHVGDSRCYRLRDGRLEQLTEDHTLSNDVLELHPDFDATVARDLPRNVTTRALGMTERVRVSVRSLELAAADTYLLCTHGLWRSLDDQEIWHVMQQALSPRELAWTLLARTLGASPSDNVSLVVLSCDFSGSLEVIAPSTYCGPPRTRSWPDRRPSRAPEAPRAASHEGPDLEILMLENEWTVPPDADFDLRSLPPEQPLAPASAPASEPASEPLPLPLLQPLPEPNKRAPHGIVAPSISKAPPPLGDTMPHIDVAICKHCGDLVESAATFCPRCGAER